MMCFLRPCTFALLPLALLIAACGGDDATNDTAAVPADTMGTAPAPPTNTLVDAAAADRRFSTFARALEAAELTETLQNTGPFTIFAPTDSAFATLPPGTLDSLMTPAGRERLSNLLLYHVANGRLTSADIAHMEEIETVQGTMLPIMVTDSTLTVGSALITQPDLEADNGLIHAVNTVLVPPNVAL